MEIIQHRVILGFPKEIFPYKLDNFQFDNCPELDFFFTNIQWKESVDDVVAGLVKKLGVKLSPPAPAQVSASGVKTELVKTTASASKIFKTRFYSKKLTRYVLICLAAVTVVILTPRVFITFKYDNGWPFFREGLFSVGVNGKYGFVNRLGVEVAPLKYDGARNFSEGLALVILNGKWGFIDKTGNEVIPLKYDDADAFREGLAEVKLNGKWGFIDKTGKEVIPLKYDYTWYFREGLAAVELNGKWGFIDKIGKEVIPLKYDFACFFIEGLARVELNGKQFFIDKNGNRVK